MLTESAEDDYDVIIVGAGPAGVVVAAWMTVAGIKTLLVDERASPPACGHADGIESRTFEILDTFGLGNAIWAEANPTNEISLWNAPENGRLQREFTRPNSMPKLSCCYSEATLPQGRVQNYLLDFITRENFVQVLWNYRASALESFPSSSSQLQEYPIKVGLSSCGRGGGKSTRNVRARFLVGCDGAHSWVRTQLGLTLEGETTNDHWGVVDCVPITNFPDIRKRCIIQSPMGAIMVIPRERQLVRFYVQVSHTLRTESSSRQRSFIISRITTAIEPYSFTTKLIEWASIYSIGRRMCKTFCMHNSVFLAGDAVHTHSPKAGQGMNTSMQDAFNLGWKIASVANGCARPRILDTYEQERLPVAARLLSFDKETYQAITQQDKGHTNLVGALTKENSLASGLDIVYTANLLVDSVKPLNEDATCHEEKGCGPDPCPPIVNGIRPGSRLPNMQVMYHCDARVKRLHSMLAVNGCWNLIIFGGNISDKTQMARLQTLATYLTQHPSVLQRPMHLQTSRQRFGSIEVVLLHSASRHDVDIHSVPRLFLPADETTGFDYSKVLADNESFGGVGGAVYQELAIPETGCMILVRPDHHISYQGQLKDTVGLDRFISRVWNFDFEGKFDG